MLIKPKSDLCWTCQQNSTAIIRAANKPETEKSAKDHLFVVQLEMSFYKITCDLCNVVTSLSARASEQGNVIGSVRIHVCTKKIVNE